MLIILPFLSFWQKLMGLVLILKYRMNMTTSPQHFISTANTTLRLVIISSQHAMLFAQCLWDCKISPMFYYSSCSCLAESPEKSTYSACKRHKIRRWTYFEYAFGAMPSLVCKNGSVQELKLCFHKYYQVGSLSVIAMLVFFPFPFFLRWYIKFAAPTLTNNVSGKC